jgi:diaminohydroxyphosphoribosylaminopyrimidine deaminase / 5-amino-6-(5-phosphoribosylamino)uracil reductase
MSAMHDALMAEALRLAAVQKHLTTPSPSVGCVIARAGHIVGRGATAAGGRPHAEAVALAEAGGEAHGADVYVSLEPCAHISARGPACSDLLVKARPRHVYIGTLDPDPRTHGRGVARLQAAGIGVTVGVHEQPCRASLSAFIHRLTHARPFVRVKLAASLDGRTALANGASQWLTDEPARIDVHRLRRDACAVMTGSGTILADDATLTVRHVPTTRQPLRIVLDTYGRTDPGAKVFDASLAATTVFTAATSDPWVSALKARGVEVLPVPAAAGGLDLGIILAQLGARPINHLLVECGPTLAGALVQGGWVDALELYLAPRLLGHDGKPLMHLPTQTTLDASPHLTCVSVAQVGRDLRLTYLPNLS